MRHAPLLAAGLVVLAGCAGHHHVASMSDARACLKRASLRLLESRRAPDDADAPDAEMVVSGRQASAFLGYYDDEARAEHFAPEVKRHIEAAGGTVERHGTLTIAWVRGRDSNEGHEILDCVV